MEQIRQKPARSIQPVLQAQTGDFLEIDEVPREQRGVVREADGGDFQVHRADADAIFAEAMEDVRRLRVEGKNVELLESSESGLKTLVGRDLPASGRDSVDESQPSLPWPLGR